MTRRDPYDDARAISDTSWAIPAAPRQRSVIDSGPMKAKYRILRDQFRRVCQGEDEPCHLCGNPIDYQAPRGPRAFHLDHFVPVSVDESLALEWSNFRASHSLCNDRRGAREVTDLDEGLCGIPSEDW